MLISVVNLSKIVSNEELLHVIRAINRQIAEDFEPYWSFGARLRLEGRVGRHMDKPTLPDLRGDAILYLSDKIDVAGLLGYHDKNARGIPYGSVFTDLSNQLKESWSITLSHEALELLADSQANLLVRGPHPKDHRRKVLYWFEMCDPVQADHYLIDGVEVSNFVLPSYFTHDLPPTGHNDFLGRSTHGVSLSNFGQRPGGYFGFFDPKTGKNTTYSAPDDAEAARRIKLKSAVHTGRSYRRKHDT